MLTLNTEELRNPAHTASNEAGGIILTLLAESRTFRKLGLKAETHELTFRPECTHYLQAAQTPSHWASSLALL